MPGKSRILIVALGALLAGCWTAISGTGDAPNGPESVNESGRPTSALSSIPLSFVENRGQTDPEVAYYLAGRDTAAYFGEGGLTLALADTKGTQTRWAVKLDLVGADGALPEGRRRMPAVVSYFKGDRAGWNTGLATYAEVAYEEAWPGIDLVYSKTESRLKYEFRLAPGADPSGIRLSYRGATGLRLDETGSLLISTPVRRLQDEAPVAYQHIGGKRIGVDSGYVLEGNTYGFRLGSYDRARPLVIDPAVLVSAGYIGGDLADKGNGIAVDAAGNMYVTGQTASTELTFPETVGPDLSFNGGTTEVTDAYVAKVNADGTGLVYAGYIGGSADDLGAGIAVDASGNAYVTGETSSTEATFPDTVGPDTSHNMGVDAFVAKVNPSGTGLTYAGYIGGSGDDLGAGIALDASGNAYVVGETDSDGTFPVTVGPDSTFNGGVGTVDGFVAKVNPTGTALSYAGYIGGELDDPGFGIALDSSGNAYVIGETNSTEATFPDGDGFGALGGPDPTYNGGFRDAYVAKVSALGTGLTYVGYIGGNGTDIGHGIAVDSAGNAYVAGETNSSEASFPDAVGPDLTHNGAVDAFVAKLNSSGTGLSYAGYIGGDGEDIGNSVALDASGAAYITGETDSPGASFPETVGPFLTFNGGLKDAFVAGVNPQGSGLSYAGYIGGTGEDLGNGIAADSTGNAYVIGDTDSTQGTFPETVGPDLTYNGGPIDAFVAKVAADICGQKTVTILGSSSGETLTGTPGDDVIVGLGGNDTIVGLGGNDTICGGDGNDSINGGDGNDMIDGGAGNDSVIGELGNDLLNGGAGVDTASFPGTAGVNVNLLAKTAAGQGSDTLAGVENVRGSSGKDTLKGDGLANRLEGLDGADQLSGRGRNDSLLGGKGNDRLLGGGGHDSLKGDRGRDRLVGGGGRDRISGGRGPDRLAGGQGRDRLNGGPGFDICDGGSGVDSASKCEVALGLP